LDRAALLDARVLPPASIAVVGLGALAFCYIDRRLFLRLTLLVLTAVGLFAFIAGLREDR
jgi:hypothetical protein